MLNHTFPWLRFLFMAPLVLVAGGCAGHPGHYTGATQGIAFDRDVAIFTSSTESLAKYDSQWNLLWRNDSILNNLPAAANHLGDIDYLDGEIFGVISRWAGCENMPPPIEVLAVFNATNGALVTWSNLTSEHHGVSSVTLIPEQRRVIASSFCNYKNGFTTLWVYDLDALLSNAPGSSLSAIDTITLSAPIPQIQGLDWNSKTSQFLVGADTGGRAGSLWLISSKGVVSGPVYNVPDNQGTELEGVDYSTGSMYYLENGTVYAVPGRN